MRPLSLPICLSIFDLLKAGPGPSSSHTIAPMKAGYDFFQHLQKLPPQLLARARGIRVRLLGSLSATGSGHGTDKAVIAGLMGNQPESCPPALLAQLWDMPSAERSLRCNGISIPLGKNSILFGPVQHNFPYSNTLFIDLLDIPYPTAAPETAAQPSAPTPALAATSLEDTLQHHILASREYYSVGGGFLQWKGWTAEKRGLPRYKYTNARDFQACLRASGLTIDEFLLENETAITGLAPTAILEKLTSLLTLMKDTVHRGCAASGLLPGTLGLQRKARVLLERAQSLRSFDEKLCRFNAYAYAAAEENAAGHIIVTAPTCGAAGVVPATLVFMEEHLSLNEAAQRKGLLAATLMGFIAKQNAGIAGAEVGCQGEIGVASAMAAALLAHAHGYSPRVVENAAEIALEHHLGLTCDPVGGYVQIPCIERNAMGAVKAYNASLIASNENPAAHKVSYDDALQAMLEIGRDMNAKYKETSTGGLAVCMVSC